MQAEGRVGPQIAADGSAVVQRFSREAALIIQNALGRYSEESRRGNVWVAATPVTGVDHGSTLGTTAPFHLHNPRGSGVDVIPLEVSVGYVSGTLGAGTLVAATYAEDQANALPTATALVPRCARINPAASPKAKAFSPATLTAAPIHFAGLGLDFAPKLATTAAHTPIVEKKLDGLITIPEGMGLSLQGICGAAGTSPLVVITMFWIEVPRVAA